MLVWKTGYLYVGVLQSNACISLHTVSKTNQRNDPLTVLSGCFAVLTCFLRSLEICCSTMVISRSTRSMFCISSSLEKRAGTKSKSGSMWTGLTGEMGSSFPMALPRSCRSTAEKASFKITAICVFRFSPNYESVLILTISRIRRKLRVKPPGCLHEV